ncbi:enoyl-CoA hydratase/isomerase [Mycolicibacterium mageritense DSM 44476 = CIP 104973]|uniref:Enoyl-CoA hydratase n=1 Tax=Mycolicibacterium mageritense TaxID=53462 RepID=A0ABN5Y0B1_MYCME|nr:enoyl-CoA hydratase/isomerase family protein [Mycolicibacterium mageritense]MCC9183896.1 enoyl-CoA hydratase/isomerase family protein [Mycolicibacterium mageritense]BBX31619.1 enoyl-CoA hydratase [Mycolicibacterium mageritense]CDO23830.1 enoyl-CoA hydratase/isomerase [Mycolicibacterium mageritense DSM 44476 = CIP 104973]
MNTTPNGAVALTVDDGIATITIHNAARANALTREMLTAMGGHLDAVERNPAVAVVVLTGAGGNFCAGLDISEFAHSHERRLEDDFVTIEEKLARCRKPTIAAVAGHCIGGGTQLAVACDLRIAAEQASFAITPAKLGLVYPSSSIDRLVRIIGPAATKRLIFTADPLTASTARQYGLITDIAPEAEFDAVVRRIASTIATRSPMTLAAAKQMTDEAAAHGRVSDQLDRHWRTMPNPDLVAGLAAFTAGRTAQFRTT